MPTDIKEADADPRRVIDPRGHLLIPIKALNPGQQCAMRHHDGKYWGAYIVVAHEHMIDVATNKLIPMPFRSVVKVELASWTVSMETMVFLVDNASELHGSEKGLIV